MPEAMFPPENEKRTWVTGVPLSSRPPPLERQLTVVDVMKLVSHRASGRV